MTWFNKLKLFNEWVYNKNTYCKKTSLLSLKDKEVLLNMIKHIEDYDDDHIMFLADELKHLKGNKTGKSYVFTYKQAQALLFCCNELGYDMDVEVFYDKKEVNDILEDFDTDFSILQELDYLFIDYIKITKKGMLNNENYKKEIKSCV